MKAGVWGRAAFLIGLLAVAGPIPADGQVNGDGKPWQPVVEIWKAQRRMQLRDGDQVVREFQIALGRAPIYAKEVQGDLRTPVGRYYVTEKHVSRFHRFLGISYPNVEDAERGYQRGLIGPTQWADVFLANMHRQEPPWRTQLGGRVGIHGYGSRPYEPIDWTEGCIAISNDEIEYLYDILPVGTPVVINE
ncbi:MAG: murein L,D-transpeptidase family protein [Candidatus Binatia bacterium]